MELFSANFSLKSAINESFSVRDTSSTSGSSFKTRSSFSFSRNTRSSVKLGVNEYAKEISCVVPKFLRSLLIPFSMVYPKDTFFVRLNPTPAAAPKKSSYPACNQPTLGRSSIRFPLRP